MTQAYVCMKISEYPPEVKMRRRGTKGKFIKHIDPQSLNRVEAFRERIYLSLFIKEGSTLRLP